MADNIVSAINTMQADLTTVAATAFVIGGAGLIAWIGWRLACKIPNRGVGK